MPLSAKACTRLRLAHIGIMKASIRSNSLTLGGTGDKSLGSMEKHGKREDRTSQERRVRDKSPLLHGGLNLRELYDEHVAGARMNKALKRPVMHAVVQFPTEIGVTASTEQKMLEMAVQFINETHGGDAVFAARLDRDEEGQHNVDVFYCPKYEKKTKSRGTETWISNSKHGKELCHKHREAIVTRHREGEFTTGPRQVGIALQEELHAFFKRYGVQLADRNKKDRAGPDRLSPEAFKVRQEIKKRAAQETENKSLREVLVKLHEALSNARDLVPGNIMALLEALQRRQYPRQSAPKSSADEGLLRDPAALARRQTDEPDQDPVSGLGQ